MYLFVPVVIETSGVFGKQTPSFLKDLACRVRKVSGEGVLFLSNSTPHCSCTAR